MIQDPVEKIKDLYFEIKKNDCDVVCSYYKNKHPESIIRKIFQVYIGGSFFFHDSDYPKEEGLYRIISLKAKKFFLENQNKIKHIKVMHSTASKKIILK